MTIPDLSSSRYKRQLAKRGVVLTLLTAAAIRVLPKVTRKTGCS